MPKYTSITGKNVKFKFKGIDIIIPYNEYMEVNVDNLHEIFPKHVKKYEENIKFNENERKIIKKEVIEGIPEFIFHEASPIIIKSIKIEPLFNKINEFDNIKDFKLINKINDLNNIGNFKLIDKIDNFNVKDIIFKEVIIKKTINNNVEEKNKEVDDFLDMIKNIIKE